MRKDFFKKCTAFMIAVCVAAGTISIFPEVVTPMVAEAEEEQTATAIVYDYCEDISKYRQNDSGEDLEVYTYPQKEGYVFAGWFQDEAGKTAIRLMVTEGPAYAKFVPEKVLSVKYQLSGKVKDANENTKLDLRMLTSVDALNYNRVGFEVTMNDKNGTPKTREVVSETVYSKVYALEDSITTVYPKDYFCDDSNYFMTYRLNGFGINDFDTREIKVTPFWVTLDGTKVSGLSREKSLVSDVRTVDADKTTGVTLNDSTYALSGSGIQYAYLKGGSDTIFFKTTSTASTNEGMQYGLTIRNGGQTRQVYFDTAGVKVLKDYLTEGTGFADSTISATKYNVPTGGNGHEETYVWTWTEWDVGGKNYTTGSSVITEMFADTAAGKHTVIYAIWNNSLYCSVDGQAVLKLPMNTLCADWQDGRYYQIGPVANITDDTATLTAKVDKLTFGDAAYKTDESEGLIEEPITTKSMYKMAYEPIHGSYKASGFRNGTLQGYSELPEMNVTNAVTIQADVESEKAFVNGTGNKVGLRLKLTDADGTAGTYIQNLSVVFGSNSTYTVKMLKGDNADTQKTSTDYTAQLYGTPKIDDKTLKFRASIIDETLYLMFYDAEAEKYHSACQMPLSEIFSAAGFYSSDDQLTLGLSAYVHPTASQSSFTNVDCWYGQEAIDKKAEGWRTYLLDTNEEPEATYDPKTGIVTNNETETGWGTGSNRLQLQSASSTWEVTGTMHDASDTNKQGFYITQSGHSGNLMLATSGTGFGVVNNGGWTNWSAFTDADKEDNTFAFNNTVDFADNSNPVTFKAMIVNDIFYMWLNDILSWAIPLDDTRFGHFNLGGEYTMHLQFSTNAVEQKFTIESVKTGSEVDAELISMLKNCENIDWNTAYGNYTGPQITMNPDGVITYRDVKGSVLSAISDNDLYLSYKYTNITDGTLIKHAYQGIVITDGTNYRRISFANNGFHVKDGKGSGLDGDPSAGGTLNKNGTALYADSLGLHTEGSMTAYGDYVWIQRGGKLVSTSDTREAISSVNRFVNSTVGEETDVVWAITDNTLYCSVNGCTVLGLPMNILHENWVDGTNYQIGFTKHGTKQHGKENISEVEFLFGDEAVSKLTPTIALTDLAIYSTMNYEPINDSYKPESSVTKQAFFYSKTSGTTVGVEADIHLFDYKDDTEHSGKTAVGISVRRHDETPTETGTSKKSVSIVKVGADGDMRYHKNHEWTNDAIITDKFTPGISYYNDDGVCHVTAVVKNDTLYLMYNGISAAELPLENYIDDYVAGTEYEIGFFTWAPYQGMCEFRNVEFTSGTDAESLLEETWSFQAEKVSTMDIAADGKISKQAAMGYGEVKFAGTSTNWTVTGTMKQRDLTRTLLQGFKVYGTAGGEQQSIWVIPLNEGFRFLKGTDWSTEDRNLYMTWTEGVSDILTSSSEQREAYQEFYFDEGLDKKLEAEKRKKDEMEFKLVLSNDILTGYFDVDGDGTWVEMWKIPFTILFGFDSGQEYGLSLYSAREIGSGAVYDNVKVYKEASGYDNTEGYSRTGWQLSELPAYGQGTLSAAVYNTGYGADINTTDAGGNMQLVSETTQADFQNYLNKLEFYGYEKVASNTIGNNTYVQYKSNTKLIYAYHVDALQEAHIIHDTASVSEKEFEYDYTPEGDDTSTFYQYAMMYNANGAGGHDVDNAKPYENNGAFYIIKLADNSVILIDGGNTYQATDAAVEACMGFLKEITGTDDGQKVRIAAIHFSHAHSDHIQMVYKLLTNYQAQIDVERVMYNIPSGMDGFDTSKTFNNFGTLLSQNYPNTKFMKLHTGQKVQLADAVFEILYTHEDAVDAATGETLINDFNSTSTMMKLTLGDKTFMLMGDWGGNTTTGGDETYTKMENNLLNSYALDSGSYLKSDVVQVAHHAINDWMKNVYNEIDADYAFFAQQDVAYSSMAYDCYKNVVRQLLLKSLPTNQMYFAGRNIYWLSFDATNGMSNGYEAIRGADATYEDYLSGYNAFNGILN